MVTRIGKLFVLFVFTLSMFFLACSIGVYSVRTKWMMSREEKSKVTSASSAEARADILRASGGVIDRFQNKIDDLAFARELAQRRYEQNAQWMLTTEQTRGQRQYYYQAKLNLLRTGKDDKGQVVGTPVQALDRNPATKEVLTNSLVGRNVVQQYGMPLQSSDSYASSHKVMERNLADVQERIKQQQEKLAVLTSEVQGVAGDVNNPGLIKKIELQQDAKLRAMDEQESLKPALANYYGEAVLLLKRQQALLQRKQELDKIAPVTTDR